MSIKEKIDYSIKLYPIFAILMIKFTITIIISSAIVIETICPIQISQNIVLSHEASERNFFCIIPYLFK